MTIVTAPTLGQRYGTKRDKWQMSRNVPLWRSADRRDRTGQKPKGFVPMSRCAVIPRRPRNFTLLGESDNGVEFRRRLRGGRCG
jgi:hypothetical protein